MYGIAAVLPQWAWPLLMKVWLAGLSMADDLSVAALGVLAFRLHRTAANPLQQQATTPLVATGIFARPQPDVPGHGAVFDRQVTALR